MNCGSEGQGGVCLTVFCRWGLLFAGGYDRDLEGPGVVCEAVFCRWGLFFYADGLRFRGSWWSMCCGCLQLWGCILQMGLGLEGSGGILVMVFVGRWGLILQVE